jgi:hypothetical protein
VIGLIRLTIDCSGGFLASTGLDLTPFCNPVRSPSAAGIWQRPATAKQAGEDR